MEERQRQVLTTAANIDQFQFAPQKLVGANSPDSGIRVNQAETALCPRPVSSSFRDRCAAYEWLALPRGCDGSFLSPDCGMVNEPADGPASGDWRLAHGH